MSYRYDSEIIDGTKVWYVTERTTSMVLARHLDWELASRLTKWLNNGGGFAGWTPGFFVNVVPSIDVEPEPD